MRSALKRLPIFAAALTLAGPLASPAAARPVVEVAFVLDTTGSMGPLIEGAKRKIWAIARSIADANADADLRMALVAYRDIGDDYVTRTYPLTPDIQDLYAHLLELRARGGGDWPESVNEALDVAVRKLAWTDGADVDRIVFLVGDAPPHMDYAQDTKYPQVLEHARRRGIRVNAVQAGDARDTARVWQEIAQRGDGRYIPIPQDGGRIVIIETPFDADIIDLQNQINGTVIPYGSPERRAEVDGKMKQVRAAPAPAASDMASYMNRRAPSTAAAVTGEGDLVADVAQGRRRVDSVKEEELPEALRGLSAPERQAKIDAALTRRRALNEKLAGVVRQRDDYMKTQQAKAPQAADTFDTRVAETLKAQIRR